MLKNIVEIPAILLATSTSKSGYANPIIPKSIDKIPKINSIALVMLTSKLYGDQHVTNKF